MIGPLGAGKIATNFRTHGHRRESQGLGIRETTVILDLDIYVHRAHRAEFDGAPIIVGRASRPTGSAPAKSELTNRRFHKKHRPATGAVNVPAPLAISGA